MSKSVVSRALSRRGAWGLMAAAVLAATGTANAQAPGADVVYIDCVGITNWGVVGGIRAYSMGTYICNYGTVNLRWGNQWAGSPATATNAYRLYDGRLEQIGMAWVKYSCCAAAGSGCGVGCNNQGGSVLGVGCRDVYAPSYNGSFGQLGARSTINASTGQIIRGTSVSGNVIFRRLQVPEAAMSAASFPGALYFVEGVTAASDDAPTLANGVNSYNNASYKRVTIGTGFNLTPTGVMAAGEPALNAWRDHGNGVGSPDNSVAIQTVDVPNDGRFHVASKVSDNGDGTWRYEYAVFNLNSHRSGGSFTIPVPAGVTVSNVGFHDVDYHSGEPYDNTDWTMAVGAAGVTWSSPQTFDQNANSNALRWATMYNFWFDADAAPDSGGTATIGLFRPAVPAGSGPDSIEVSVSTPAGGDCPADWNGDGSIDSGDISSFLTAWIASAHAGNLVADFNDDGATNSGDISAYLTTWVDTVAGGC